MEPKDLNEELGNSDIYLIDQILKNRFDPGGRILDAGCGEGRNMTWFIRNDFNIYGMDISPEAVRMARLIARSNNRNFTTENILEASIEDNPFPDGFFDCILCINVLHSAKDKDHFFSMVLALNRILNDQGRILISMTSEFNDPGKKTIDVQVSRFKLNGEILDELGNIFQAGSIEPLRTLQIEGKESISYFWMSKKTSFR